jgi:hypothetical protein
MNILILLALIAFLASAIWSAIQRTWPLALLALGLVLLTLTDSGLIAL